MSTAGFGRLKRRKTILRSDGIPPGRAESETVVVRQALLLQLALKALDRAIADYRSATRGRRPSYAALTQYLEERERGEETEPANGTGAKEEIPALLQPAVRVA
ncbi:MAG TPA: hypothetical protein VKD25_07360 [Burkholderiales bacterium]|nr:hypothetical protein [Burkholderiales bacterium]